MATMANLATWTKPSASRERVRRRNTLQVHAIRRTKHERRHLHSHESHQAYTGLFLPRNPGSGHRRCGYLGCLGAWLWVQASSRGGGWHPSSVAVWLPAARLHHCSCCSMRQGSLLMAHACLPCCCFASAVPSSDLLPSQAGIDSVLLSTALIGPAARFSCHFHILMLAVPRIPEPFAPYTHLDSVAGVLW